MVALLSTPEVTAAIIGALTTILTGVIGFAVLLWRLRKEAQRAIEEMQAAEATKLKLRIYDQEVTKVVDEVTDAEVELGGFIRRFETDMNMYRDLTHRGMTATVPIARVPTLIELKSRFDSAAVKIVIFVETWLVVDPRFSIFQTAINAAKYEIDARWAEYFGAAVRVMPIDLPNGTKWVLPDEMIAAALIALGNRLIDALQVVGSYTADFRCEMQSILVGGLFNNTVPRREPLDPRYVVVRLDNVEMLEQHFNQTPWGEHRRDLIEQVRSQLETSRSGAGA